ncbi:MAG: VanW family protein [Desulfotomaculales bacterium]
MRLFVVTFALSLFFAFAVRPAAVDRAQTGGSAPVFARRVVLLGRGEVSSPGAPEFAGNLANAKLALSRLDGFRIMPGGVFSFNEAVGPRTVSRGFVVGLSGSGGTYYQDVGGGVCQAATALHRAVTAARLQVLERHLHPGDVPYAPGRDDAAVAWDVGWDYRFQNTLPFPVVLKTRAGGRNLTVEILADGLPSGNYRAAFFIGNAVYVAGGGLKEAGGVPFNENGRVYVAARDFARTLDASEPEVLSRVRAVYRDNTAFVPARDAAVAFGRSVFWDNRSRAVLVL